MLTGGFQLGMMSYLMTLGLFLTYVSLEDVHDVDKDYQDL